MERSLTKDGEIMEKNESTIHGGWVHEDHWIAVKVDIEKCKLVVFDCNLQATLKGEIEVMTGGKTESIEK